MHRLLLPVCLVLANAAAAGEGAADRYPEGLPADRGTVSPPDAVLAAMRLPPGFRVDLVAAEPRVAQVLSMDFDERGRLWVAQCFSYKGIGWTSPLNDRITVLSDGDGDGTFESATVFTDQARNCTGVCTGRGGVWALMLPKLVFIPDRNGDAVPDGPPEVVLDGFNADRGGHCVANNPTWGPDGWIYGQHGIQGDSRIGAPGASPEQRTYFAGGIWRYHPERKVFEVVCTGTTNPWGLDWDEHGEAFFTNTVIGHLWHAIPGAHLKRMYGSDGTPNTYHLLDQIGDHRHWAGSGGWKGAVGEAHAAAGGGHAHAGLIIYQGDNWPESWRGALLMNNLHGRRINVDRLERAGSGYVGHHEGEHLVCSDPSFRPVPMRLGPDGCVYLGDWAESGDCHAGNHRRSGRIWRVAHGAPRGLPAFDLARVDAAALVATIDRRNVWYVRQAIRLLRERALAGHDLTATRAALATRLVADAPAALRLRALWLLHAAGGIDAAAALRLLDDPAEDIRAWAVRLLVDAGDPGAAPSAALAALAAREAAPRVRLALAAASQRLPAAQRWPLIEALAVRGEDAGDVNLPAMCWYALEPLVMGDRARALKLAGTARLPLLVTSIARRLAQPDKPVPEKR